MGKIDINITNKAVEQTDQNITLEAKKQKKSEETFYSILVQIFNHIGFSDTHSFISTVVDGCYRK